VLDAAFKQECGRDGVVPAHYAGPLLTASCQ